MFKKADFKMLELKNISFTAENEDGKKEILKNNNIEFNDLAI